MGMEQPLSGSDVITILSRDHREVAAMFKDIEDTPLDDHETRVDLLQKAIIELVRHSIAEEEYLYPATRAFLPDGDRLADREIAEHTEVEETMKGLEALDPGDPHWNDHFHRLVMQVQQHVSGEEGELFPLLATHADSRELDELGAEVLEAKRKAPTRPHPRAPHEPPLNKLLAPGVGLVDRARDIFSRRGR